MRTQAPGNKYLVTAVVGIVMLAGAIGGTMLKVANVNAQTTVTTAQNNIQQPPAGKGPHTANGITEQVLTGGNVDKAKAAAIKAVPGATILRLETDAEGDAYEAHMTKSDGTMATVKFDSNFNVTRIDSGFGGPKGGHIQTQ